MSSLNTMAKSPDSQMLFRQDVKGDNSAVLTDIYQEHTNIVVWQRSLANSLAQAADSVIDSQPTLEKLLVVAPQDASVEVEKALGCSPEAAVLAQDIAQLVDMFCCLFDLKRAALRFSVLDRAMCPRFHVDRVPCRLVTTYQGIATEWLPHNVADRSKLGAGNMGKPDELSGLYDNDNDINQLQCGDVALLKGELWHNNAGAGLIHRSPQLKDNTRRLLLTIDFIDD
ncbi:MAG: DUF1826 domain-containing protein [Porticoccaceae bacterium]